MSKYIELIANKSKFLDYIIDKYSEDLNEGKKEFVLINVLC